MKQAIETSGLSSRWRFIWTSMPYLNFSIDDFPTLPKFSKFAADVLSHRNNLTEVYSMKLNIRGKVTQVFVKRILSYAFSHNIQQLNVVCLLENNVEFPLALFSSKSLKHLSLTMNHKRRRHNPDGYFITPTSTWDLPALTTLELDSFILCDDEAEKCVGLFLKRPNLNNLILRRFRSKGSDGFSIVHPRLSNLTLKNAYYYHGKIVNVTAPLLKNLTISYCTSKHVISAPDLACLFYKGSCPLNLSTDGFHSLEKVDIHVGYSRPGDGDKIIYLLKQIHSVRFLTISLEIFEALSSYVDLILQPSPFVNLKSIKIYPYEECNPGQTPKEAMSTKVKSYLIGSSPGSAFTIFFREEVKAQKIMAELRVILVKENNYGKTDGVHLDRGKAKVESRNLQSNEERETGGNVSQLKSSHWKNMRKQADKARLIFSKLQSIKELVTKLPEPNKAKIKPCLSSLCAEADIVVSMITNCIKIQCDENQSLSSACFHEFATT